MTATTREETGMASQQSQELARRAGVIYEQRLRAQLEHTHPDEFVAIEPDSGDYFLGRTLSDAIQAARSAHPTRLPFILRVGHKATVELGAALS
jgi:hypothetical protein